MNVERWSHMFLGMSSVDKDGSSVTLAMILIQSIIDNNGEYDPVRSLTGYLDWFEECQLSPHIDWDIVDAPEGVGPTSAKVFQRFLQSLSKDSEVRHKQLIVFGESLFDPAEAIHRETKSVCADVSAIYRCLPLALLHSHLNRDQLATVARTETRLTHASKIAQQSSAAAVLLAADLLAGISWKEGVRSAAEHVKFTFSVKTAFEQGLNGCEYRELSRGGYCTDVLKAVIYFITQTNSFHEAVSCSFKFAKPNNFCPILVGAFGGLVYGIVVKPRDTNSTNDQLDNATNEDDRERVEFLEYQNKINNLLLSFYDILKDKPRCY